MNVTPGLERLPAPVAHGVRAAEPASPPLIVAAEYASAADRSPDNVVAIQSSGADFSTLVNAPPLSSGSGNAALALYRRVQSGSAYGVRSLLDVHA